MHKSSLLLAVAAAFSSVPLLAHAADQPVLTGQAAFGGWEQSAPGVERLIKPADLPAPYATKSASNAPGLVPIPAGAMPKVPPGFSISEIASGFDGPRVVRVAPNGDLFVADSVANTVNVLRLAADGTVAQKSVFADGLNQPYGIAFYPLDNPQWVYVANSDSVVRYPYKAGDLKASAKPETIIPDIPSNHHWTRDIAFSPDGKTLYLDVGSGSNIGEDVTGLPKEGIAQYAAGHALGEFWNEEEDRADVRAYDPDGKNERIVATGLRNCSGMTIQPETGAPWCVVNERDELGDNLVPDYATSIKAGAFYGWPWYYTGSNEDPRAPLKGQRRDLAGKVTVPDVLFQAHSAPLNITFYEGSAFPADYKGSAFVAMHGSWNRGTATGYKVVRLLFENGKPTGVYEDFITGFGNSPTEIWGRPVGVAVAKDGSLIVTEDGSGTIWRVTHENSPS